VCCNAAGDIYQVQQRSTPSHLLLLLIASILSCCGLQLVQLVCIAWQCTSTAALQHLLQLLHVLPRKAAARAGKR
jgi:hypothetical protein